MLIHGATDNEVYPPMFGASQRTFGLYRGLARRHSVRLLCVVPNRTPGPREQRAEGVTLLRRKAWYTSAAWRLERCGVAPLFSATLGHRLAAGGLLAALGEGADVLCADLNLASLFERSGAKLRVYSSHNVEADHFRAAAPRRFANSAWAGRVRRHEARAIALADLTVVCADEDAERMRALYGALPEKLLVAPNGYDETRLRPPASEERAMARLALGVGERDYLIALVGSNVATNRAALAWTLGRVMPPLSQHGFKLLVVGSLARALRGETREPWLIARGEAPDLLPLLHAADAGLNPMTEGGGSNVKLPTYLAAGLAVITTPFGLRGYAPLAGLVTVAEPADLAEACLSRPLGWRARGLALPVALGAFAWGSIGERLGEVLALRLGVPGASRPEETRGDERRMRA